MAGLFSCVEGHLAEEEYDEALQVAEQAVTKCREANEQSSIAEALRLQISALIVKGDRKTAAQVAKDNLAAFSSYKLGKAKMLLGSAEANSDKRGKAKKEEAMKAVVEAQALFEAEGDKRMEGCALVLKANLQMAKGEVEEAIKAANSGKALYKSIGDRHGEGIANHCLAAALARLRDIECCSRASEAIQCFQGAGQAKMEAFERVCLAKWTLDVEDKPKKALQLAQQAAALCRRIGSKQTHAADGVAVECYMALAKQDTSRTVFASKAVRTAEEAVAYFESIADKTAEALARESLTAAMIFLGSEDLGRSIASAMSAADTFAEADNLDKELQMRHLAASLQLQNKNALEAGRIAKAVSSRVVDRTLMVAALDISFKSSMQLQDYSAAKDHAKKMVSALHQAKDKHGEAMAKLAMCQAIFMEQDHAAAVSLGREAQAIFHDLQDVLGEAAAARLIAKIHFDAYELEFALRAATKQRSLLRDCGNLKAEADASLLVADIRMEMMLNLDERVSSEAFTELFFEMLDAAKDARSLGRNIGNQMVVASALSVMAQAYVMVSELAEALEFCEEAAGVFREHQEDMALANLFLTEAEAWFLGGESGSATKQCNRAMKIFQEKQDDAGKARAEALLLRINPPKKVAKEKVADVASVAIVEAPTQKEKDAPKDPAEGLAVYQKKQLGKLDMNNLNRDLLRAVMYNVVQETVGYQLDELEDDLPLMQAGIASRTAVTMRATLEDEMPGISFPATLVFDFPTITSIMDYIEDTV